MRSALQLLGGVAVAGAVAAGSTAFTAVGFTNNAGASVFVGGTITQSVTGAKLSTIGYTYLDATNTGIKSVLLTFADSVTDTKTPTISFTTGAYTGNANAHSCTAIESTGHTSTCTFTGTTGTVATWGWLGATAVDVSVA